MKRFFFILFVSIYIPTTVLHAQTDTSCQNWTSFSKGMKALLFQISNNFTLRSFEGGMISFKRHFSEKKALRIGISFSGNHYEYKQQRVSNPPDSTNYKHNNVTSSVETSAYATFVRYFNPKRKVKSYLGLGFSVGYDHSFRSYYNYNEPGMNEWTIGPHGLFGVEWFPCASISIIAEYNCSGFISFGKGYTLKSKNSTGTIYKSTAKTFGYGFGQQAVRFGLSVYL